MKKNDKSYTTIALNVPNDLFNEFTKLSKDYGIPRTHFIILSMRNYLDYQKTIDCLPSLVDELKSINNDKKRN